jgi:hypothetical protein
VAPSEGVIYRVLDLLKEDDGAVYTEKDLEAVRESKFAILLAQVVLKICQKPLNLTREPKTLLEYSKADIQILEKVCPKCHSDNDWEGFYTNGRREDAFVDWVDAETRANCHTNSAEVEGDSGQGIVAEIQNEMTLTERQYCVAQGVNEYDVFVQYLCKNDVRLLHAWCSFRAGLVRDHREMAYPLPPVPEIYFRELVDFHDRRSH